MKIVKTPEPFGNVTKNVKVPYNFDAHNDTGITIVIPKG